jgi:hypothetical protein
MLQYASCSLHEKSAQTSVSRLLMPSNFCFPPLEYSRGTIPTQAASPRPFRNAVPAPIAATKAVAVTGPTPGNRCQAPAGVIFPRGLLNDGVHLLDPRGELVDASTATRWNNALPKSIPIACISM